LTAYRILEFTKLQQRVKALRYQVLPDPAWLVVNTVFHTMRAAGYANTPFPMIENMVTRDEVPKTQTMRELFLSIHMLSKFDVLRWPTEWQIYVFAYTRSIRDLGQYGKDG